jgi:hypothetical protein
MEVQFIINVILVVAGFIGSMFVKDLVDKVKTLDAEHKSLQDRYVRRDDFKDQLTEIKSMLDKIFDRLETKVDKQ